MGKKMKRLLFVAFLVVIYIVGTLISIEMFTIIEHKNLDLRKIEQKNNIYILTFEDTNDKEICFKYSKDASLEIGEKYVVYTNSITKNKIKEIERNTPLWKK